MFMFVLGNLFNFVVVDVMSIRFIANAKFIVVRN